MEVIGWLLLIGLLGLLIYGLVQAFLNADMPATASANQSKVSEEVADQQRIEALPVNLAKKKGDFLSIARDLYEQGDYANAIVYLFSHRLLQLDRAGQIRLTKGKTNRQYLQEIRQSQDMSKILGQTIVAFEEVFFGEHVLTRERFERCWNHNDQFQTLIKQVMV